MDMQKPTKKLTDPTIQFSHSDLDGLGSIIVAEHVFENITAAIPCDYHDIDSKIIAYVATQKAHTQPQTILITDINVKPETAEMLNAYYNQYKDTLKYPVILLDHHQNTHAWLNDYSWATVEFLDHDNVKNSGTSMVCAFGRSHGVPLPESVERFSDTIRSYDTWDWFEHGVTNGLINSTSFQLQCNLEYRGTEWFLNLFSHSSILLTGSENRFKYVMHEIKTFATPIINRLNAYVDNAYKKLLMWGVEDDLFGLIFAEKHISILGSLLHQRVLNDTPELDMKGVIIVNPQRHTISLRSRRTDVNMGHLAKKYFGGGGHPQAAGAEISDKQFALIAFDLMDSLVNGPVTTFHQETPDGERIE